MNDRGTAAMQALPDGEAELTLVVRLPWEDVARLGQRRDGSQPRDSGR